MQFPVELKLRGSRAMKASVWVVHVAAALALFHVPAFRDWVGGGVDPLFAAGAWGLLMLSLFSGLRAQARLQGCTVWLERDGTVELSREFEGEGRSFRVRSGSQVVLPLAVWFTLVPVAASVDGRSGSESHRLLLVPGNLSGGSFRLLRIWLRHCAGRIVPEAPGL